MMVLLRYSSSFGCFYELEKSVLAVNDSDNVLCWKWTHIRVVYMYLSCYNYNSICWSDIYVRDIWYVEALPHATLNQTWYQSLPYHLHLLSSAAAVPVVAAAPELDGTSI